MIPFMMPDLTGKERSYLIQAYDSGWIGSKGDFIDRLEDKFATYIGTKYAITCSSGTAALHLAYVACGMKHDMQVYVPQNTFQATLNMAVIMSQKVIRVAQNEQTWLLDMSRFKDMDGILVGVHLYGNPLDYRELHKFKGTYIEDCAQSLGSTYRGQMTGSFGKASIFSFHSAKMVTAGEGGMVCTNDKEVADTVRHFKNHSMTEPYKHNNIGFNYRMTNLQAAIACGQLERIDELIEKKLAITKYYNDNLSKKYIRQSETHRTRAVKWANAYRHHASEKVRAALLQSDIETRPGFMDGYIVFPSGSTLTQVELETIVRKANEYANTEAEAGKSIITGRSQEGIILQKA